MKKKIIFLESILKGGGGHHMDNLIETTLFFNKENKIEWIVNNNFEKEKLFVPNSIEIKKLITDRNPNTFINFLVKIQMFFRSIFFFLKLKKLLEFFKAYISNYFSIPEFFNLEIYKYFENQNFTNKDILIIQSCRPKDVELIFFISQLVKKMPKIIMRVLYPPKKKIFKDFYFHTKKLSKKHDINIFTEVSTTKKYIQSKFKYKVENFTQIYSFYDRKIPDEFTLGFLGETRLDKGFNRLPKIIQILSERNIKCNFLIQFSKKIYPGTEIVKKKILDLARHNRNLTIVDGYIDFWEYREYLKKINLLPLLYDADKLNFVGSGLFYSCITHEIPMIIPRNAKLLHEYLVYKSFETATTDDEYVDSISKIINNYDIYLSECKKFSKEYYQNLKKDPLVLEVEKN